MKTEIPYYHRSIDWDRLIVDYPPPPHFNQLSSGLSEDEKRDLQNRRFMERVSEAWQIPFYINHWGAAGLEPGDVRSLEDICLLPPFTSDDLKKAIQTAPPYGSHHPLSRDDFHLTPIKIQTSGGTTGMPRPTLFDPVTREVQGIQMARALYAQGARPGDVLQIPFTLSLANAGWTAYTAACNWLGCSPLTTGSGRVTPSERQLEFALEFGVNGWYIGADYLGRLTQVAEEMKLELRQLKTRYIHTYLGPDADGANRQQLEQAWGAPIFDNYGSHEIGLAAFECAFKRRHISEDTVYLEVIDENSGDLLSEGGFGNLVATTLYRSVPPFIRYNLRDRMAISRQEACPCGLHTRGLSAMMGRTDEMVKLRGTNIYPLACQTAVKRDTRTTGEYICVVFFKGAGVGRREEMTIRVERRTTEVNPTSLREDLLKAFFNDLGVRVNVEIVDPGVLADQTGIGEKPRRLLDLRSAN